MGKFFKSLESIKTQRRKNKLRSKLARRNARLEKLRSAAPDLQREAELDSIAFRLAAELRKD